jgi:hypothetical protein
MPASTFSIYRRILSKSFLIGVFFFVLGFGILIAHAAYERYATGDTAIIGEFVYDDEYTPVTSATCTVTSRYPDGSLYLNSQAMTGAADGWYAYSFTTPSTAGQYRTQVCCTVGTDYMCLDKAFEAVAASSSSAPTASEVAAEVWSYSGRTLTGFGSLVSDIWGHSARALTGFGTLAQDIWNHNPRTTTD